VTAVKLKTPLLRFIHLLRQLCQASWLQWWNNVSNKTKADTDFTFPDNVQSGRNPDSRNRRYTSTTIHCLLLSTLKTLIWQAHQC